MRKSSPADVYATDDQGILKNSIFGENARERTQNAIKDGVSVIAFFGGSTMMSMGSVTPNFSIPSLVERILAEKYNKRVVCINFGLGGTCCREAFQLYLNEIQLKNVRANTVFYDGWNCASYLTYKKKLQFQMNKDVSNFVADPDSMMSIHHNIRLYKAYDLKWHIKNSCYLFFAYLTDGIQKLLPKFFGSQFLRIQGRFFPLNLTHQETNRLLKKA